MDVRNSHSYCGVMRFYIIAELVYNGVVNPSLLVVLRLNIAAKTFINHHAEYGMLQ
jgi:hypothetical protein